MALYKPASDEMTLPLEIKPFTDRLNEVADLGGTPWEMPEWHKNAS